jgi:hypothetical protein
MLCGSHLSQLAVFFIVPLVFSGLITVCLLAASCLVARS